MKKRRLAALFLSAVMSAGVQRAGPMSSTESPTSLSILSKKSPASKAVG